MDDLVELPLIFELEPEKRTGRSGELAVPDPHQNRQVVLEAFMVDPDAHLGFCSLGKGVRLLNVPNLQDLERKRAPNLSVGPGRDNLDVVAKLKVAAFLGKPSQRPLVAHWGDGPKVVLDAALDL